MKRLFAALSIFACALPAARAAEAPHGDATPPALARLAIGVAPFEAVASFESDLPDLAAALAEGIAARGVSRVIGPAQLGPAQLDAAQLAEPPPERVRKIAMEARIDALVVGRTTRLGNRLSVDVRLRSGRSGAAVGTYVAEIAGSESLEPVVARLAEQVVSGALALAEREDGPRPAPPASAAAPATEAPAAEPPRAAAPFGLDAPEDDQPLSVRSDELEATEKDRARTLIFRRNVEVRRGDLTLRADWLQAFYPPDAKQPSHLAARGGVTVAQGTRSARCDRADYDHAAERIVCSGGAELRDGDDRIVGEQIAFDLAERRVRVDGGVEVVLGPRAAAPAEAAVSPAEGMERELIESEAPLAIQSDRLEALDRDGRREILFEGNVQVARSDATLRSHRLEALYPERARQPDRLVATGQVAFRQGTREARCERATYHRAQRRVECAGDAELWDGEDRVRGEMIAFDLDSEKVVVTGRTRLQFRPDGESSATAVP